MVLGKGILRLAAGAEGFVSRRVATRLVVLAALTLIVGAVGLQPHAAHASGDVCGLTVYDPMIHFSGIYLGPDPKLCGVEELENDAYVMYAGSHGMDPGDPRIVQAGQYQIAGILWSLFLQIIDAHKNNPSSLTTNENGAYDWLRGQVNTAREDAANKALDEYNKWKASPCTYQTPDPQLFSFDAAADPACGGGLSTLFAGPSPPSFTELVEMGQYDANKDLYSSGAFGGSKYESLATAQILESQATWSMGLLGAIGPVLQNLAPDVFGKYVNMVRPFERARVQLANQRAARVAARNQRSLDALEEEDTLQAENEAPDVALEDDAALAGEDLTDAGLESGGEAAASLGAESLSGPFFIVGIAAAILVQETIHVVDDAKIPQQLQDNINAADAQELADLVENPDGGGYSSVFEDFAAQLRLSAPSIGPPGHVTSSPPDDGSVFEVEYADDSGTTRYTEFDPTVNLVTWPLGIDQGVYGPPQEQFAYYNGQIWRQIGSQSDDHLAGLSGWIPSGELHYYDWTGHPRVALIDGSHFIDFAGPGSVDVSAYDQSPNACNQSLDCQQTNVIFALVHAGGVTPSYTTDVLTNGGFTEVKTYYPSDGTLTPPFQKIRLVLKPDTGAPAVINVDNQWGDWTANSEANVYPNGGLHAGDTVTLTDPLSHPFGAATTYTWKVESRCAFGQVCTPDLDPAFHGHPTVTLTGQSVNYTWPAPGTYHIELTTLDQYGHTRTSSTDETVVGSAPSLTSVTSNLSGGALAVLGTVQNGSPVSVTGCVKIPAGQYADPHVSFDWGDGTVDTATAESGSTALSIHYGTVPGCDQPWQFTATHTYDLTSAVYQRQLPLHYTVTDGLDPNDTITLSPYTNVTFAAAPTFSSPDTTTFTAGVTGYFAFSAVGQPAPTLSYVSGSLPFGLGIATDAHGVLNIDGDANINDAGGSYPITVRATNSQGSVDQTFTLVLDVPPKITSSASSLLPVDQDGTVDVTASGYPAPDVSISGSIPGMSIVDGIGTGDASITGTPTTQGLYTLTVKAANAGGTATQTLQVQVGSAPAFTSDSSAGFTTANASSFIITTTGSPTPSLSITSGSLPAGLTFADRGDGTAEIYGQPTGDTTAHLTIKATNAAGSATQDLTVTTSATGGPNIVVSASPSTPTVQDIDPGPAVVELYTIGLTAGSSAETATFTSSDSSATFSTTGQIPSGMTFTDNHDGTATLSGTPDPSTAGTSGFTVEATPSGGGTAGIVYVELEINGPPVLTSDSTADFTVGTNSTFTITAAGLFTPRFTEIGDLPAGLSFDDPGFGTATISGTPEPGTAGTYTVEIDSESLLNFGNPVKTTQTIEVDEAPSITSDDTAHLAEGVSGSVGVTTGGYPAPALTVVGDLPPGIAFTDNGDGTGTFSGTPTDTTEQSYPVTVEATNKVATATQDVTLDVGPLPQFSGDTTASFLVGSSSASLPVASFTDPDITPVPTLSATGLPSGLTLTDNGDGTGTIGGTPDPGSGGLYTAHVTATNAYGSTSQDVSLIVDEAPSYAGLDYGSCTSPDPSQTSVVMQVDGGLGTWTPCATGYPTPTLSLGGTLPSGTTFTDNGDGSATITGAPATGTGGVYSTPLTISNAVGSTTVPMTVEVDQQAGFSSGDFFDTTQWVAGQENSYTATLSAYPMGPITVLNTPPLWLTVTPDPNNPGTVVFSGNPPPDELGQEVEVDLGMSQGFGNGIPLAVLIDIKPFAYSADTPPDPRLDSPYAYRFATTAGDTTFAVADGSALPDGLTLSSDGLLSGTPTTVARSNFSVVATNGDGSVTTEPIDMSVLGRVHALEISSFRLYGPEGRGDWFVTARNMTSSTIPLYGWKIGVFMPGQSTPVLEALPAQDLAPGAKITLAGPNFSLAPFTSNLVSGPPITANPGGFELVSSDGTVSDRAGIAGAPDSAYSGTPLAAPSGDQIVAQSAFVRRSSGGTLVDTDDNASDFTYQSQLRSQTIQFTTRPPADATVGGTYAVAATGGGSGNPVTFTAATTSLPAPCMVLGSVVTFFSPGTCEIDAHQAGDIRYSDGSASQSFTVLPVEQTHLAFTSSDADLAAGTTRTLTAQLEDEDGNVVPVALHVKFAQTGGTGTVNGLGSVTAVGGVASREVTGASPGPVTITASAGSFTATATFTVVPGAPAKLAFTSSNAALSAGTDRSLSVLVTDAAGNVVTSGSEPVTFAKVGGVGRVTGLLANVPSSSGSASDDVTGGTAGYITVQASSPGLAPATAFFKVVPGAPAQLVFTSSTGRLNVGHGRTLTVELEDAEGNRLRTPALAVTFAQAGGDGAVSGLPQTVTAANGKASAGIEATRAGAITISATAPGMPVATTSFTIKR